MLPIKNMLIPATMKAYTSRKMNPHYITIHETDNYSKTADAVAHGNYLTKNNSSSTGWHFTVDDKNIIQHSSFKNICYHAGDGRDGPGNTNSLGIEICVCKGMDLNKVRRNTIELIAWLIQNYPDNFSIDRVVQHHYWTKKNCPRLIRKENKWDWFINEIKKELGPDPKEKTKILTESTATKEQIEAWIKEKYIEKQHEEALLILNILWSKCIDKNINPVIAIAQFSHETGFLYKVKSNAGIDASYHNPCGLKVKIGGSDTDKYAHKRFKNWEEGLTAYIDHLSLYLGLEGYPKTITPDPRHFTWIKGKVKTVEDLGQTWCISKSYAPSILKFIKEIQNTKVELDYKTRYLNSIEEINRLKNVINNIINQLKEVI